MLYYVILNYVILNHAILNHAILYYAILCYTIQYHTIRHRVRPTGLLAHGPKARSLLYTNQVWGGALAACAPELLTLAGLLVLVTPDSPHNHDQHPIPVLMKSSGRPASLHRQLVPLRTACQARCRGAGAAVGSEQVYSALHAQCGLCIHPTD